ncbi:MAG TPA: hypothetical protein VMG62_01765 [Solirubrobacteraceae bacterium]|nr:hypothetical protein [Solirubrobacteraceae bacterium]
MYYRHQPAAFAAIPAIVVVVLIVCDYISWSGGRSIDSWTKEHELGSNLIEHVLVAVLVAAVAYYLVLGLRRQQVLRRYRELCDAHPEQLVEWSEGKPPVVRRVRAELLAEGIARSDEPAVAVVEGRAGTGRTSFLVALVRELAEKELIPVPVWAKRDGTFHVETLAAKAFCDRIDRHVSSRSQAETIWRRARASRDVVILVDGLDEEVVEAFMKDEERFEKAIAALGEHRIAIVLFTTRKLPFKDVVTLREDLDLFTREEAREYVEEYVNRRLEQTTKANEATVALERLHDRVDDSLVAPFYLELIAGLREPLGEMPENRDRWRASVLERYLDGLANGTVVPRNSSAEDDTEDLLSRGRAARKVAEAVAKRLRIEEGHPTIARAELRAKDRRALQDAVDFSLLWQGREQVGFAADDLGAFVIAGARKDPASLLEGVRHLAARTSERQRRDRYTIMALIFWHLRHDQPARQETFDRLLGDLETFRWTRPAVVAAVVRIASTCDLAGYSRRIALCVERCIAAAQDRWPADPAWYQTELISLVRALADWRDRRAHELLWSMATAHHIDAEWPAAVALATAPDRPETTLREAIREKLDAARSRSPREMSRHDDQLGKEIASLAWILPTLRENAEEQFERVKRLCLEGGMSPLRGEMSLAQGLKLAIVNRRSVERNIEDVRELLFAGDSESGPPVRFWHARLVLVQATLAHAWPHGDTGANGAVAELDRELRAFRGREPHPLVRHGVDLAREGLRALASSPRARHALGRYMWTHERDAVRWVEQGKGELARLAADTVLLSNMTYELRRRDEGRADHAVANEDLPPCIRRCSSRRRIVAGDCYCAHGLCRPSQEPVIDMRARFSESFCREQVRLASQKGPPPWMARQLFGGRQLVRFWEHQAAIAAGNRHEDGAGRSRWWPLPDWRDRAYLGTLRGWRRSRNGAGPTSDGSTGPTES